MPTVLHFFIVDSNFKKLRRRVIYYCLSIGLVVFCVLLDYIIWKLSTGILDALLMCLPLNCLVYVVYRLMGPMWVYWGVWKIVPFVESCGLYVSEYPILCAGVTIVLFLLGTAYSCWLRCRRTILMSEESFAIFAIHEKIGRVLSAIDTINNRLEEMEKQIDKVAEQQQKEMATLRKKLS